MKRADGRMSQKQKAPELDGIMVVNKPAGRTSHDVVEAVRRLVGFRGIGHLGTLDPLATGVLVLALGRATRLARFYVGRRKRYTCAVRFGFETDTYDADGEPAGPDLAPQLTREQVESLAANFLGPIQQVPPAFSAKKIKGRVAHELARKKKPVKLEPVAVQVHEFVLTGLEGSLARFEVECSSGTYIRSLAHDMGKLHGAGAHLAQICRTAVGEFTLDQAATLDELSEAARNGKIGERLIPLGNLLQEFPRATVLPIIEKRVRHGAKFNLPLSQVQPGRPAAAVNAVKNLSNENEWTPPRLRVFNRAGELIAIAEPVVPRTYQPLVVFEAAS